MHITSTLIPEEVRGKGYGKVMMEAVLPEIEAQGYRVVPVCPYVIKYMATHPEWHIYSHNGANEQSALSKHR